ncbi:TonB-dependent receptor [Flavobacterium restrictum]|uniref:TonB-dependent receptor n=1 Tax=Flavobacterium restrictum TaxID=2594428 RepID=A0A553E8G8_9FLAO|nr:TonB-dependent receptor [Flavobacterium restrictum]TRX41349.1 TonB-dependent receptor [Flavobacterium restrictum]
MKKIFTFIILVCTTTLFSQSTLSGKVVDEKGNPIAGANIYIEGTYDGASSSETGDFTFVTTAAGNQILVVSFLIYETSRTPIEVAHFTNKTIKLRENVNSLDAVVVTAGTLEAGDKARVSVLKPLDIVTTAGSAGNIIAALQTLPGTQNVGEDGRLFVRGGEANETQTFVDGIRVAQPYGASTNNLPTRGRFSPFLFSGISFSTGGYSAEYGEALSSVLLLNTQDEPDQNKTEISLMTVGLGLGNTQKWKKSSLSVNTAYINLAPYQAAIPQNVDWNSPFQSLSGETVYRYNFNSGILKVYAAFDASKFDLNQESVNYTDKVRVDLNNNNFYFNASYKGGFGTNWQLTSGLSYGYSKNKIGLDLDDVANDENASHLKIKLKKSFSDRVKIAFGADYFITKFNENFTPNLASTSQSGYNSAIAAVFTEADIFFSKKLAAKVGLRASNNDLLNETTVSPRISFAYKMAKNSQFSFAYGDFTQTPSVDYIKYSKYHQFESEKASHYILNFQYNKSGKTFRAEAYYKDYSNLVKYDTSSPVYNSVYANTGSGYAKGIDLFWRDGKSFKNLEYWISYSYIDTQREYKNFPIQATPSFVADHSLSIVTKYWISDWKSQIGFTNSFATGRPYNNPNETQFMNGKTKAYNNLSFNWAYLLTQQKILYFSVSNVMGTQNVYGYDYAKNPNASGIYNRKAIVPTADRFFFVGFFWTISNDKKDNQLKNL